MAMSLQRVALEDQLQAQVAAAALLVQCQQHLQAQEITEPPELGVKVEVVVVLVVQLLV